jgi:hypothetical protein
VVTKGGYLKDILELFCDATCMVINVNKSAIFFPHIDEDNPHIMSNIFNFPSHDLGDDVKYLGYNLKPNSYDISDWKWLLS